MRDLRPKPLKFHVGDVLSKIPLDPEDDPYYEDFGDELDLLDVATLDEYFLVLVRHDPYPVTAETGFPCYKLLRLNTSEKCVIDFIRVEQLLEAVEAK